MTGKRAQSSRETVGCVTEEESEKVGTGQITACGSNP